MNLAKLGLGALNAAQYKMKTAAHNVNNAAVEGYNRQTVLTQTAGAQAMGGGYVGRGVEAVTISRSYDNFLFQQLVAARGQNAALSSYSNEIRQVDTLFADRTVGISPALENFFKSVNAVASEPLDPAAREEMLGQANNLATQVRETNAFLQNQRGNINTQITTVVDQINSYVQRIHDANVQITKARASVSQHEPNDLLDQRDQLLSELNELVGITVFEQDGNFNLAIGNGQTVLGGNTVYPLRAQPSSDDPQRMVVAFTARDGSGAIVGVELNETYIRGGKLGGLLQYRQEVLDGLQNDLGRLAVGLAAAFNDVHAEGYDLHGASGDTFFSVGGPNVVPSVGDPAHAGNVSVEITTASSLTTADYRVTVNDDGEYVVTNLTTKQSFTHAAGSEVEIEGVTFTFAAGSPAQGDHWLVQPTRNAAALLRVEVTDPSRIAAAGESETVPGTSKGESNGDVALKLAALQYEKTLGGSSTSSGTMSLTEAFSQIVNRVGVASQQNATASKAQQSLVEQTYAAQQQLSGVNLNEEYVNLEQYLEQFRAASRMIEVSNNMFDTLLNLR
ncbi:flagellar hook-associated protein FlgK [Alcaligenaceae bacterium]|nr:flagellar hook-associated protein FlgK [Alcaligenaceae bacterium]